MLEIRVSVQEQQLYCLRDSLIINTFPVSTAKKGLGEESGSWQTPRGWHQIRAMIGGGALQNTVFVARRPTGEIYNEDLAKSHPERDWILTRILWLSGLEPGVNRFGDRDSMRRYIYIHGTPESEPMGVPASHGCIRMRNQDVTTLFDWAEIGTKIFIC